MAPQILRLTEQKEKSGQTAKRGQWRKGDSGVKGTVADPLSGRAPMEGTGAEARVGTKIYEQAILQRQLLSRPHIPLQTDTFRRH